MKNYVFSRVKKRVTAKKKLNKKLLSSGLIKFESCFFFCINVFCCRLQLAYCYHKQGRTKQAHQTYTNLIRVKSDDAHMVAIASNNIAAINKDQNLFDSKKKMKSAVQEFNKNITSRQAKTVYTNNCLLLFYLNQTDNCLKACDKIEEIWPEDKSVVTVIRAFVLHKDGKSEQAIEVLKKLTQNEPQNKLFLQLAITQILLETVSNSTRKHTCISFNVFVLL